MDSKHFNVARPYMTYIKFIPQLLCNSTEVKIHTATPFDMDNKYTSEIDPLASQDRLGIRFCFIRHQGLLRYIVVYLITAGYASLHK